jgi:hypothetical protein
VHELYPASLKGVLENRARFVISNLIPAV